MTSPRAPEGEQIGGRGPESTRGLGLLEGLAGGGPETVTGSGGNKPHFNATNDVAQTDGPLHLTAADNKHQANFHSTLCKLYSIAHSHPREAYPVPYRSTLLSQISVIPKLNSSNAPTPTSGLSTNTRL